MISKLYHVSFHVMQPAPTTPHEGKHSCVQALAIFSTSRMTAPSQPTAPLSSRNTWTFAIRYQRRTANSTRGINCNHG